MIVIGTYNQHLTDCSLLKLFFKVVAAEADMVASVVTEEATVEVAEEAIEVVEEAFKYIVMANVCLMLVLLYVNIVTFTGLLYFSCSIQL